MLESIAFVLLLVIGTLVLAFGIATISLGFFRKSKGVQSTGQKILLISLTPFALIFIYYYIFIPLLDNAEERTLSGAYSAHVQTRVNTISDSIYLKNYSLLLNKNNTFEMEETPYVNIFGTGTWELNGEGGITFYSLTGTNLGFAPSYTFNPIEIRFNLYDPTEVVFKKEEN